MRSLLLICAASALLPMVRAAETENVLEVTASAETTLADWLTAQSISDVSSYTAIHFKNTAKVSLGTELQSYAGEIRLKTGAYVVATSPKALGTTVGITYVESGATLAADVKGLAANTFSFGAEPIHFAGTGADGKGALQTLNSSTSVQHTSIFGTRFTLLDDALVSFTGGRHDWSSFYHTLNGYTLTVKGSNNCLNGGTFTAGHLTFTSGQVILQSLNHFRGGDTNLFTFAGSSFYQYWGMSADSTTPWTMVFDSTGSQQAGNYGGNGSNNIWKGPLWLKRNTSLVCYNSGSGHRFKGYVYGPGKITVAGNNYTPNTTGTRINLYLDCPTNAFTGGIDLNYSTLHLSTNGALPATGGKLLIQGGTVDLSGTGDYTLPEAQCAGTGKVWKATGAWTSFKKTGSGACVYDSAVGAGELTVTGGGIAFPCASVSALPAFGTVKLGAANWLDFPAEAAWSVTNLYACGIVSNATATVTDTLYADPADCTAGRKLALPQGGLVLDAAAGVDFPSDATPTTLDRAATYTLATAAGGVSGRVRTKGRAAAAHWYVRTAGNDLVLFHQQGAAVILR